MFLKLKSDNKNQNQFGSEIVLKKQFIEYYYYEREISKDSHDRMIIIVKYGNELFRLKKDNNDFEKWFNSKQ